MNYPTSYENVSYESYPGLTSISSAPYDWSRSSFSTTPFSYKEESKFDFPGFLYGAGALAEGIGNAIRGFRGEPPVRMAQENLARYLNKGKDPLASILAQISQKQGATNNPLIRPLLSGMFADTFSV